MFAKSLEEAKRLPPWAWVALVGGGAIVFWRLRSGASGTSTAADTSASDAGTLDSGQSAPAISGGTATGTTGTTSTTPTTGTTSTPAAPSAPKKTYTVKPGDTLGDIGWANHTDAQALYSKNTGVIESTAKAHGFSSSDFGHWIFPGEVLVLP